MSTDRLQTNYVTETTPLPPEIPTGSDARFLRVITFVKPRTAFAIVQLEVNGVEQEMGMRLDLDKQIFLDHRSNPEAENLAAREIVSFLGKQGPARSKQDDLKLIRGVGPAIEKGLHDLGITSFARVASWTDNDIAEIEPQLGISPGRIRREGWVEHAARLMRDLDAPPPAQSRAVGAD